MQSSQHLETNAEKRRILVTELSLSFAVFVHSSLGFCGLLRVFSFELSQCDTTRYMISCRLIIAQTCFDEMIVTCTFQEVCKLCKRKQTSQKNVRQ